ncbi:MAG: bifunctional phosphoribosylaminoimidazolecarboxamide formyltransferase/IMP cyclohydrolase [Deltaproteobacteria bacterium]|nr:bifunctional phosphoribosylaminoimidazolecarboxamide formyltransferase/IMP cyclohydrolase [Deltaproteobacteria bacterium]MDZ4224483.1 bifunctional phosphoribosylaminoimidazolecarboxamide formyltransferase/IMP cyclohydrolase [bacterium]
MTSEKIALISVYDKTGLEDFTRGLVALKYRILSTGKTAQFLKQCGLDVEDVSHYTGFPEILSGRVKTLHPKIHAGVLARRHEAEDQKAMRDLKIPFIDLVAVNLYPFESQPGIEMIDVGGPTMLRAAAKNFEDVLVVCDPADYKEVLSVIARASEAIPIDFRKNLAAKVFERTSQYDAAIAEYFNSGASVFGLRSSVHQLRYGENPHQKAYFELGSGDVPLWEPPIQGKELSYNNILDADAAWGLIHEWTRDYGPGTKDQKQELACVIVKHANPCGVALSDQSLKEAFEKAYDCDPISAFGGIVGFNKPVDGETAQSVAKLFLEVILAPGFSKEALQILSAKKNLRLLISRDVLPPKNICRSAGGGRLIQDADLLEESVSGWRVATKRKPTPEEMKAMEFAWKIVKYVKSNAIVFASHDRVLGIGAGQTSRVDAVKIAAMRMSDAERTTRNAARVVASDAFFPFPDNIEEIAKTKATAIIQPGGSVKDAEVIAAADRHDMAMVFTGARHFRH